MSMRSARLCNSTGPERDPAKMYSYTFSFAREQWLPRAEGGVGAYVGPSNRNPPRRQDARLNPSSHDHVWSNLLGPHFQDSGPPLQSASNGRDFVNREIKDASVVV